MSEKKIKMWDVKVTFRVRRGSHEASTKKELEENILGGIGKNEMNCIDTEDILVEIK